VDTTVLIAILLLIHVAGAIIGFGPTFTFAILGPMAGRSGAHGIVLLEAMEAIEKRLTTPVALFFQPASGVAMIFVAGFNNAFFSHYWLWSAIIIYVVAIYLSFMGQNPRLAKMIAIAKAGPPTPEFLKLAQANARGGQILTVLLVVIIILMVTKPGG
jgi:uncharacterized membrane protein